jgi:hypothetical protein
VQGPWTLCFRQCANLFKFLPWDMRWLIQMAAACFEVVCHWA